MESRNRQAVSLVTSPGESCRCDIHRIAYVSVPDISVRENDFVLSLRFLRYLLVSYSSGSGSIVRQYAYSPYGEIINQTGVIDTPYTYIGAYGVYREAAHTGLYHMKARYYHAGLKRFISKDPIGLEGGVNWYVYTHGNPIWTIDPSGLKESGTESNYDFTQYFGEPPRQFTERYYDGPVLRAPKNEVARNEAVQALTLGASFSPASPFAEQFAMDNAISYATAPGAAILTEAAIVRIVRFLKPAPVRQPIYRPTPRQAFGRNYSNQGLATKMKYVASKRGGVTDQQLTTKLTSRINYDLRPTMDGEIRPLSEKNFWPRYLESWARLFGGD